MEKWASSTLTYNWWILALFVFTKPVVLLYPIFDISNCHLSNKENGLTHPRRSNIGGSGKQGEEVCLKVKSEKKKKENFKSVKLYYIK